MQLVRIEVIAPIPEGWGLCLSCEAFLARASLDKPPTERGMEAFPPDWQAEYQQLSDLILDLAAHYGDSIRIHIFDPRSLQGMLKSLRYGVRRYPAFVVQGRTKVVGLEAARLEQILQAAGAHRQAGLEG